MSYLPILKKTLNIRWLMFLGLLFWMMLASGCNLYSGEANLYKEPSVIEGGPKLEAPKKEGLIRFSAIGVENPVIMAEQYEPLLKHLQQVTGRPFQFVPMKNYDEVVEGLGKGQIDIARLGPVTYTIAYDTYNAEVITKPIDKKIVTYKSYMVVRKDSPIQSIAQIRGTKFAFGDPKSTSSHYVPRYMLKVAGIDIANLAAHSFTGSHDNSAQGVINGSYDAAGIKDSIYEKYKDSGAGLRIIAISEDIAESPIVVREKFDAQLRDKIQTALINLKDPKILHPISKSLDGFEKAKLDDYEFIRRIARELDLKE